MKQFRALSLEGLCLTAYCLRHNELPTAHVSSSVKQLTKEQNVTKCTINFPKPGLVKLNINENLAQIHELPLYQHSC